VDYIVLGAGPGGLQMGAHLQAASRDYLVLERNAKPGSFFQTYPRHRIMDSFNKVNSPSNNSEHKLR
jgi:cation diffusion facilitator CzcD-associated flavoprotein CzcO